MNCSKRGYPNKAAALGMITRCLRRRRNRPRQLRTYYCESCNAWHLTKQASPP